MFLSFWKKYDILRVSGFLWFNLGSFRKEENETGFEEEVTETDAIYMKCLIFLEFLKHLSFEWS